MSRGILLVSLLLLSAFQAGSQVLKGRITTESGDAIPYATVYIQELKQGTTTNTKGDYEIRLPSGKFQVIFQSLGYSPVFFNLNITDQTITKNVILPLQYYQIPEVRITATGEDPAYWIMRRAIGMAPYYLNYISYYKADVYLKGNLYIKKIPRMMKRAIDKEARKEEEEGRNSGQIKEGDVYMMESVNEIEFTAPETYVQKVRAIKSTFPDEDNSSSPMDYIQASFYQPLIANMVISPLSPRAFSYYKFRYQGATPQGKYTINKIQVIPKMKSQQLLEGIIYIVEDLWCLHSVDLTNRNIASTINIQQIYVPVQNDIWMPVSDKFTVDLGILGVKAEAGYGVSVKYTDVKVNNSLIKPENFAMGYNLTSDSTVTPVQENISKTQQKIGKLLEKDQLTNRDMVTLSRLMESESKKSQPDSVRKNLEIKEKVTHNVEKDAAKKDSAYWAEIRPVPLSEMEARSIYKFDSIKKINELKPAKKDTASVTGQKKKKGLSRTLDYITSGHNWSDTTGFGFYYGGLLDLKNFRFNPVDGFTFAQNFMISKNWKKSSSLNLSPTVKWAFSRERLLWSLNGTYSFNRMKQKQVFIRTGMTSRDLATGGSINTLLNSVTSLFMKNNYLHLYQGNYLNLGYRTEIVNGLRLELSAGYEDRNILENNTNFSFIKSSKAYTANMPQNEYLEPLVSNPVNFPSDQRHYEFVTNVTFTPRQRYSIFKNAKIPRGSEWPTFTLEWKHFINEFSDPSTGTKHYDMIRAGASKRHDLGAFTEIRWSLRTGGYLDSRNVPYYDFFHFNSQPLAVILDDYQDAFRLPSYYSMSTPEFFGEAHFRYTTPYLLLKYLPWLSKRMIRENLSLSYLGSRFHTSYTEIGYFLSGILGIGQLGVYTGFEDLRYKSTGVRCVIGFN